MKVVKKKQKLLKYYENNKKKLQEHEINTYRELSNKERYKKENTVEIDIKTCQNMLENIV